MGSFKCVPRMGGGDPLLNFAQNYLRIVYPAWAGVINNHQLFLEGLFCVPRMGGGDPLPPCCI